MPPKRTFRDAWLHDDELRVWLRKVVGNPHWAYCHACRSDMSAEITSIKRHKMSKFHTNNMTHIKNAPTKEASTSVSELDGMVTRAEIKLATFMAEHNIALNTADHLLDLLKDIFPNCSIAQMSLKRSKATYAIKEISKTSQQQMVRDLKRNRFSIIIDETTDISTSKTCAVVK